MMSVFISVFTYSEMNTVDKNLGRQVLSDGRLRCRRKRSSLSSPVATQTGYDMTTFTSASRIIAAALTKRWKKYRRRRIFCILPSGVFFLHFHLVIPTSYSTNCIFEDLNLFLWWLQLCIFFFSECRSVDVILMMAPFFCPSRI